MDEKNIRRKTPKRTTNDKAGRKNHGFRSQLARQREVAAAVEKDRKYHEDHDTDANQEE